MEFKYRYVSFGTNFELRQGARTVAAPRKEDKAPREEVHYLYANEIACDVGGQCLGFDGFGGMVFDHHFARPAQYASASACVLHHSRALGAWRPTEEAKGVIWLVTHTEPDLDAFCSLYLARLLLSQQLPASLADACGLLQDGSKALDRKNDSVLQLDWTGEQVNYLAADANCRWALQLAGYVSRIDQGKSVPVPRSKALHSVLYAARARNRPVQADGAFRFFEVVRRKLSDPDVALNPLMDDLFAGEPQYQPELQLLQRQELAYERDIRRARKSRVYLPSEPMETWFPQMQSQRLSPEHLKAGSGAAVVFDGIWIRDPECLLFKEFARADRVNSSMGQGFTFTAVAYSSRKSGSHSNSSEYFFSLDPEKAGNAHLYPVWADLQMAEQAVVEQSDPARMQGAGRSGFQQRTAMADPWFDGHNFRLTIVVTPGRGTELGEGNAADLTDDAVANRVRRVVEQGVFAGTTFEVTDFPFCGENSQERYYSLRLDELLLSDISTKVLRVASIPVQPDLPSYSRTLAKQIGELLWKVIEEPEVESVPSDFEARHLIFDKHVIAVWNRNGVAIAYKQGDPRALRFKEDLTTALRRCAQIKVSVDNELTEPNNTLNIETRELLREFMRLRISLNAEDGRLLQRFLNAIEFNSLLDSLHSLAQEEAADADQRRERLLTFFASIFIVPSLLLAFFDAVDDFRLAGVSEFWQNLSSDGLFQVDLSHWLPVSAFATLSLLIPLLLMWRWGRASVRSRQVLSDTPCDRSTTREL